MAYKEKMYRARNLDITMQTSELARRGAELSQFHEFPPKFPAKFSHIVEDALRKYGIACYERILSNPGVYAKAGFRKNVEQAVIDFLPGGWDNPRIGTEFKELAEFRPRK